MKEQKQKFDLSKYGQWFDVTCHGTTTRYFVKLNGAKVELYQGEGDAQPQRTLTITPDHEIVLDCSKSPATIKLDDAVISSVDAEQILRWGSMMRAATFISAHRTMDDFEILAVLGRGFYGKVQLCKRKADGVTVAIKTMHKARLMKSGKVPAVFSERRILAMAQHPFIIQFYESFQNASNIYIVMEYAEGGELFHHLQRRQTIPADEAKYYIAELALAINYLHNRSIVYRDIKPENVLLDGEGFLKLTDFGLSKELTVDNTTGTFCGTLEYLSPEAAAGRRYGREVDWWGLGVLTYELLFGQAPFSDPNHAKLLQMIRAIRPRFPHTADPVAVEFIMHLLAKDPAKRGTFETIRGHKWMEGVDFEKVLRREVKPKFVPSKPAGVIAPHVDAEFRREVPMDSMATPVAPEANVFQGFSCVMAPESLGIEEDGLDQEAGAELKPSVM